MSAVVPEENDITRNYLIPQNIWCSRWDVT